MPATTTQRTSTDGCLTMGMQRATKRRRIIGVGQRDPGVPVPAMGSNMLGKMLRAWTHCGVNLGARCGVFTLPAAAAVVPHSYSSSLIVSWPLSWTGTNRTTNKQRRWNSDNGSSFEACQLMTPRLRGHRPAALLSRLSNPHVVWLLLPPSVWLVCLSRLVLEGEGSG